MSDTPAGPPTLHTPPLLPPASLPDLVTLCRAKGMEELARQIELHVESCRQAGEAPKVRAVICGTLEKFVGRHREGDEPFEILRWSETDPEPGVPLLVFRRRANVEIENYAPAARLACGRIVGRDWFPVEHHPESEGWA